MIEKGAEGEPALLLSHTDFVQVLNTRLSTQTFGPAVFFE